jgi:SAM-dependent methyltransferase
MRSMAGTYHPAGSMNVSFLNQLRIREIQDLLEMHGDIFRGKKVIEIGGGTGVQADVLARVAESLESLEIEGSAYVKSGTTRVTVYDGHRLPFPDASVDVVYSSNVLEHIAHRDAFQREIMRILKPGGHAVHTMPTQWWKLRDMLETILLLVPRSVLALYRKLRHQPMPHHGSFLEYVIGERHGEFGNTLTEPYHFAPHTWLGHFRRLGWKVVDEHGGGLFYTGRILLAEGLPWRMRRMLARWFGSSVHVYLLQKQ